MAGLQPERLRICNSPQCLEEFVTVSGKLFYCPECNKKRYAERRRQRFLRNREENLAASRAYYCEHREESISRSKKWAKDNPEKHRESARRSKARKREREIAIKEPARHIRATKTKNPTHISDTHQNKPESVQIQENLKKWEESGEMRYCERMHLKALNLPCGKRDECYCGKKCRHAPELTLRQKKHYIDLFLN